MRQKPNLFIVGAPKCGTTAIATWLSEHPDIYFSPKKEPHHFFCPHGPRMSPEDYQALFAGTKGERIIAEGSVWYLFSRQALERIKEFNPDAQVVVCLRNPVDMAISLHAHLLAGGIETVSSFKDAWSLRGRRKKGDSAGILPMWRGVPQHTAYDLACQLGTQLEGVYRTFPKEQVHTVLLDDVRKDPETTWAFLLAFLDIAPDGRQDFAVVNPRRAARYKKLQQLIHLIWQQKRKLGISFELGILSQIYDRNVQLRSASSASQEVRDMLMDAFLSEVRLLESLLQRDLSSWYANSAPDKISHKQLAQDEPAQAVR